ncbi:MAG: hypothetical protein V2A76_02390 [Planctomycetota bacterium]
MKGMKSMRGGRWPQPKREVPGIDPVLVRALESSKADPRGGFEYEYRFAEYEYGKIYARREEVRGK